ncbi:hypothetical protein LJR225_000523 [Phenylobacterium sp. LjRoot225]|uniref:hypothetical protein n=1 Tax=Phenylobacterium sp. LjRoot225 TaxID=3342285 RepID=UPI003ECE6FD6
MFQDEVVQSKGEVRLAAGASVGPLSVELTLDRHVYLHEAELVQACGRHARMLPQAYKDESSVVWRQVEPCPPDAETTAFTVGWRVIANAAPGATYAAALSVRDARGELIRPVESFENPVRAQGQIGPAANPTDIGRLSVRIA